GTTPCPASAATCWRGSAAMVRRPTNSAVRPRSPGTSPNEPCCCAAPPSATRARDWSGPVEGFGVGEWAAQPGMVRAQDADLEVRLPVRHRRGDLVDRAELEAEPAVVGRGAEQRGQPLPPRTP